MSGWSGRKVRRLIDLTLSTKGTTCHLCQLPGADSADHDPPRRTLVDAGMPDPDAPEYLWPAHLLCNVRRKRRPITVQLQRELRAARLRDLGLSDADADTPLAELSPRFARARASLLRAGERAEGDRKSVV